jgi:hydrogenase nickel incorporation protein HypB
MAVLTKMDMAEVAEFDQAAARQNILAVRPEMEILQVSAKTGEGMENWLEFLLTKAEKRSAAAV